MTHVVITTVIDLSSSQLEAIKTAVSKKYGKDVTYETVINPEILGGIQVAIDSRFLDGSVKAKVDQLKKQI